MTHPGAGRIGRGALLAAVFAGGCFDKLEEYRQLAPPPRPAGAHGVAPVPNQHVFPLLAGARYDYDAHFGLGGPRMFDGSATLSVLDAYAVGGREVDQVGLVSRYMGRTRRDLYTFVQEDGWVGLAERGPDQPVTAFLPDLPTTGQRWVVHTGEGSGDAVLEGREDVTVPAGTFKGCYRVGYLNAKARTRMTLWLAAGTGLVRARVDMVLWPAIPLAGELELARFARPLASS